MYVYTPAHRCVLLTPHLSIQHILEIHYVDIFFKCIGIKLEWYHNNAAYLRSQQTWR